MFKHLFFALVMLLPYAAITQHTAKPNAGARGLSTANSSLLHRNVHSLHSNPAGLAYISSRQVTSSVSNRFLLKELQEFPLEEGLQRTLETQYEELNNVETILESLAKGNQLLNNEQAGVLSLLLQLKQVSARLGTFGKQYETLKFSSLPLLSFNPAPLNRDKQASCLDMRQT